MRLHPRGWFLQIREWDGLADYTNYSSASAEIHVLEFYVETSSLTGAYPIIFFLND